MFAASLPATGREWWISDGTAAGTRLLADLRPGNQGSNPFDPVAVGEEVFFQARAPVSIPGSGSIVSLWKIDPELRIEPLGELAGAGERPAVGPAAEFRGRYLVGVSPETRTDLFRSDGTAVGTRVARTFSDGFGIEGEFVGVGNDLFFLKGQVPPETGSELWVTDGTFDKLDRLTEVPPISPGPSAVLLSAVGSRLIFTGISASDGAEPWISDGTAGRTAPWVDLLLGPESSDPQGYVWLGERILLTALNGEGVRRLLALDATELAVRSCIPQPGRFCLGGDRYEVLVDWRDPRTGDIGRALGESLTFDTGQLWFFDPQNLEIMVKILDGTPVNGFSWVFYGSLTDVEFAMTVTDTVTGVEKTYHHEPGNFCGRTDTAAFEG